MRNNIFWINKCHHIYVALSILIIPTTYNKPSVLTNHFLIRIINITVISSPLQYITIWWRKRRVIPYFVPFIFPEVIPRIPPPFNLVFVVLFTLARMPCIIISRSNRGFPEGYGNIDGTDNKQKCWDFLFFLRLEMGW